MDGIEEPIWAEASIKPAGGFDSSNLLEALRSRPEKVELLD